jgi:hypothetical protein
MSPRAQASQGLFKVVIGPAATMHGAPRSARRWAWAAFAGSRQGSRRRRRLRHAMTENEQQPVLNAINIIAIHQHMSHEQLRYRQLPQPLLAK